jgi:hypothetical protein
MGTKHGLGGLLLGLAVMAGNAASAAAAADTGMVKFASIWEQPGDNAALDRWYRTVHSREALLFVGPWLRRYWAYRGYDAPPEADAVGAVRYRLTEMWYANATERREADEAWYPLSPPSTELADPKRTRITQIYVPAIPDERYVDGWPRQKADYLRWVFFMRYPDGVTPDAGDRWFREVYAPAMAKAPGVRRFVCYNSVDPPTGPKSWRRMCEMWFDDYAGWKAAVLDDGAAAPVSPWGGGVPGFPIVSIFTHQAPDMDFLRDDYRAP